MERTVVFGAVLGLLVAVGAPQQGGTPSAAGERKLTRAVLEDKIRGGWAGQMVGVAYGQETEFKAMGRILEGPLPVWSPELVSRALDQDDLYVEMTFMEVMERVGLDATTQDHGEAFRTSQYMLWHANAAARRLLNRGVTGGMTGHPKYNVHANDIDFQIEADFIGLMTPGLPQEANKYCDRVGRVMNHGDGLYGGMFVASLYSAAFFENDPRRVVEQALASLPAGSTYAAAIRDVLDWSKANPADWRQTWHQIENKWNKDDSCPDGSMSPFNIDARLNGAYIALGLVYGGGDFAQTMEVSMRAGQDSDCNPSSAAGVLGVILGYSGIPERWTSGIPAIADKKFSYTNYSYNDIVRLSVERAAKLAQRAGGTLTDTEIRFPDQAPSAPALEQWSMGKPDRAVNAADEAWSWTGAWTDQSASEGRYRSTSRVSVAAGDEASLAFTGTAIALVGQNGQDGGRARIHLDGKLVGEIDSYVSERTLDHALWHTYGLQPGKHVIRIVTTGEADTRSSGRKVAISRAIAFR